MNQNHPMNNPGATMNSPVNPQMNQQMNTNPPQSKMLTLSEIPQIIDINQGHVNFEVKISIISISGEKDIYGNQKKTGNKFLFCITTQENIDSNGMENLQYKQSVDGGASFGMKMDKNVYSSYVLVLKAVSNEEFPVKLDISFTAGETVENINPPNVDNSCSRSMGQLQTEKKGIFTTKNIVIGIIIIGIIGVGVYFFFIKKKSNKPQIESVKSEEKIGGEKVRSDKVRSEKVENKETLKSEEKIGSENKETIENIEKSLGIEPTSKNQESYKTPESPPKKSTSFVPETGPKKYRFRSSILKNPRD